MVGVVGTASLYEKTVRAATCRGGYFIAVSTLV
jgi:hypothetical protein